MPNTTQLLIDWPEVQQSSCADLLVRIYWCNSSLFVNSSVDSDVPPSVSAVCRRQLQESISRSSESSKSGKGFWLKSSPAACTDQKCIISMIAEE